MCIYHLLIRQLWSIPGVLNTFASQYRTDKQDMWQIAEMTDKQCYIEPMFCYILCFSHRAALMGDRSDSLWFGQWAAALQIQAFSSVLFRGERSVTYEMWNILEEDQVAQSITKAVD